jgi:Fe-S cluster biogenesis protein NfuA
MTGGAEIAGTAEIADAIVELNRALRTHGGSVQLVDVDGDTLRLRMIGLCAACVFKPVTTEATIRPFVAQRLGMQVQVLGARVSAEAQARMERAFAVSYD